MDLLLEALAKQSLDITRRQDLPRAISLGALPELSESIGMLHRNHSLLSEKWLSRAGH